MAEQRNAKPVQHASRNGRHETPYKTQRPLQEFVSREQYSFPIPAQVPARYRTSLRGKGISRNGCGEGNVSGAKVAIARWDSLAGEKGPRES